MMERQRQKYDWVVILGARVGLDSDGKMAPAFHTRIRARAGGVLYILGRAQRFILTGGYNIGVRYDLDLEAPVFGAPETGKKPDFSDLAKRKARHYRSEASVIAEEMRRDYRVPSYALVLEEDSSTTSEAAFRCLKILRGVCCPDNSREMVVGILTNLYHMKRALEEFQKAVAGTDMPLKLLPVFAEEVYVLGHGHSWIEEFCSYYDATRRGGRSWPVEEIRRLLSSGKSLVKLL